MKKKALLSSVLTIALCLSLIAGSTFALFTSESKVNVAVSSGNVEVVATVKDLKVYSPTRIDGTTKEITDATNAANNDTLTFANGGTATTNGNELVLDRMMPGDYVTFKIEVKNKSNVSIQYRTVIEKLADTGLWNGLVVKFNDVTYNGVNAKKTEWIKTEAGEGDFTVDVKIELPTTAGDIYQDTSCKLAYTVEAVQGNADMPSEWDGESSNAPAGIGATNDISASEIHITSAAEFAYLMANTQTPNSPYCNKTFVLDCDIDFDGQTITGIGSNSCNIVFSFDGNNHTIKNFTIDRSENSHYAGLFQQFGGKVMNLKVENATVIGNKQVGVIASNVERNDGSAEITNCEVKNCTVVAKVKKAGAITGYLANGSVNDCKATDCVVYCADTDVNESGKLVGYVTDGMTATGTVDNVDVYRGSDVKAVTNAAELRAALDNPGNAGGHAAVSVALINDIDMSDWVALNGSTNHGGFTIEGNGFALKNMSAPLFDNFPAKDFTVKNLNFENANINTTGTNYAGVLVGIMNSSGGGTYLIENCNITASSIKGYKYAGGFIGFTAQPVGGAVGYLTIKDCTVKNTTVTTDDSGVGGFIGHNYIDTTIENCKVLGTTYVSCAEDRDNDDAKAGIFVGTVYSTTTFNNCKVDSTVTLVNENSKAPLAGGFVGRNYRTIKFGESTYIADGVMKNAAGEYEISNANGLVYCATTFNRADNTLGKTFKLTKDIDMTGINWTPWGNESQYFNGTFDGQNHTIKNLTITDNDTTENGHAVGFIGRLGANADGTKTLKNVTFDNANVSGHHWVGVAVGYNEFGIVDNVKVTNSNVTATCATTNPNLSPCGDKVGALIGQCGPNASYVKVTNCSAANCTVKAARDAAKLIGYGYSNNTYGNLSATNVTVTAGAGICSHDRAGIVSANALVGNGTESGLTLSTGD